MNKEQKIIHEWMAAHGWPYWTPHELEAELGDILYALACFANAHQINLDTALQKSHEKVITRDLTRFT